MERKLLVLGESVVEPGERKLIRFPVGHLASGTRIYIHVNVNRSTRKGPTLLLIGGMHGDEINGTEIVRRAAKRYGTNSLECGTLITIPLLNLYGFIHFTRDVSDGKDVNRSFPGSAKGSLASRIANIIYKKILPEVDVILDFHTGGGQRYNYPQIRYSKNELACRTLADVFHAPFMLAASLKPNSLRQYAQKLKIPTLAFEGGEATRFDGFSIEKGLQGIQFILQYLQMVPVTLEPLSPTQSLIEDTWVRAPYSGIFIWQRCSGVYINKGEILGSISDPDQTRVEYIKSKISGYIIGHTNAAVVHVGDALFHIGR